MLQESFVLSYFILLHVRYADGIAVGERQGQCWISGDGEASSLCLGDLAAARVIMHRI